VTGLDAHVKKATEAAAPLLEGGVEFLIGTSVKTLVAALQKHMQDKELNEDALFKDAGDKKMSDKAFVKYLTDLPEAIGHDEISAFSEERRAAIFKRVSADGKKVTKEDFKGMFRQKITCLKAVAVTDKFEVEGSETICKLEQGAELEIFGPTKEGEAGMIRSECTVDGKNGWVSIKQKSHSGAVFLTVSTPFRTFCSGLDKALADVSAVVQKASSSLIAKMSQGGVAKEGRLKEARDEMAKLKEPISKAQKEVEGLRQKVAKAKGDFANTERLELSAHIEARNAKEAAPFVEGPKSKLEALEADAKGAEDAGASMVSLTGEELQAFATPASVLEAVTKFAASVTEKAVGVREAVKEQNKAASEVTPRTGGITEAQKQLKLIGSKVDELTRKTTQKMNILKGKCKTLVDAKLDVTSEGIRKHAQKKSVTIEALFDSLKKGDKIPESAFCKLLESLEGLSISPELAKLVSQKLEADGISKEVFMTYVVIYYKVVKTIAFTDTMDITTCKTLRKGEEGEVVEVLEGPVADQATGMSRIRAKSTRGEGTEGWITLSGSKGTAFLEKTKKPAETPAKA